MIAKGVRSTHTLSLYRENKGTDPILTLERTKEARVQVLFVSLLVVEERSSIPTLVAAPSFGTTVVSQLTERFVLSGKQGANFVRAR